MWNPLCQEMQNIAQLGAWTVVDDANPAIPLFTGTWQCMEVGAGIIKQGVMDIIVK